MVEYVDILPTFLDACGGEIPQVLEGRSFLPVLKGQQSNHKDYAFGIMTTRGIINGSDQFGIRSVRSTKFKYIRNLTPEETFRNACVTSAIFGSWQEEAAAGDADAAEKVRRYQHRPYEELYAIEDDGYEWKNLADDPAFAKVKQELSQQLDSWMKRQGDLGKATELAAFEHQTRALKQDDTSKNDRGKKRKKRK
jgi:N-sulfoglucosamine sulfohydrolase